jgi:four helix bundle protein
LPKNTARRAIGNQLVSRRTSVGANYRSACRERSKADFISKLGIVVEEADGSDFWLELLIDGKIIKREWVEPLLKKQENLPLFSLVR